MKPRTQKLIDRASPAQTTANAELRWNLRKLRNRSRELARNKGVMVKFLSMLAMNVVGAQGIALRVVFDPHGNSTEKRDLELAAEIESAWSEIFPSAPVSVRTHGDPRTWSGDDWDRFHAWALSLKADAPAKKKNGKRNSPRNSRTRKSTRRRVG
jgi:capsid protein